MCVGTANARTDMEGRTTSGSCVVCCAVWWWGWHVSCATLLCPRPLVICRKPPNVGEACARKEATARRNGGKASAGSSSRPNLCPAQRAFKVTNPVAKLDLSLESPFFVLTAVGFGRRTRRSLRCKALCVALSCTCSPPLCFLLLAESSLVPRRTPQTTNKFGEASVVRRCRPPKHILLAPPCASTSSGRNAL